MASPRSCSTSAGRKYFSSTSTNTFPVFTSIPFSFTPSPSHFNSMPAYLNALPGEGVHIVTVNEDMKNLFP